MTTKAEVQAWVDEAKTLNMPYVVVVCDCFDYSDFPVFCKNYERAQAVVVEYMNKELHRVMELIKVDDYGRN